MYRHILPASFIGVTVSFMPCVEFEISVEGGYSPTPPTLHLPQGVRWRDQNSVFSPVFFWEFSLRLKQILLLIPYGEEKCCY